ncbi:MAG: lipopolysaccharide biosynthesis protein [Parvibaculaceae bacterium]
MDRLLRLLPRAFRPQAEALLTGSGEVARSGRGALTAFAVRVVSALLAFLTQIFLARWMGAFEFGVFSYSWVWVIVLGSLVSAGFATSVVRFLPEYRERQEWRLLRGFLRTGRCIAAGLGILAAILAALFVNGREGLLEPVYILPLTVALVSLPAYGLTDFQDGVGRAQGWIDLALIPPYIVRPVLLLAFIGIAHALAHPPGAASAALALAAACWLTALVQYLAQKQRFRSLLPGGRPAYAAALWVRTSLPLLMIEGFTLFILNLDVLLLEYLRVPADRIGIYFAALKTISLIAFVHFSIAAVAMPRFAALHARGERAEIGRFLARMQKWCFWPSLAGALVLLALGKPLLWLFGPDFVAAYPVMFILAAGLLARAASGPAQNLLAVSGHQDKGAMILFATLMINAGLGLALIPRFGIEGAAMAIAAAFVFEAIVTILLTRRYFPAVEETAVSGSRP